MILTHSAPHDPAQQSTARLVYELDYWRRAGHGWCLCIGVACACIAVARWWS